MLTLGINTVSYDVLNLSIDILQDGLVIGKTDVVYG
jgi:hypothetical protein